MLISICSNVSLFIFTVGQQHPAAENGAPPSVPPGGAGSGESEIRKYVLENDLLEGIIALPTDMFYNTGISTYIWILSNKKPAERKGKVQLIDGSEYWQKMRKSLGSKRKELSAEHIEQITKLFGAFEEAAQAEGRPAQPPRLHALREVHGRAHAGAPLPEGQPHPRRELLPF